MNRHRKGAWLEIGVICLIIGFAWWCSSKGLNPVKAIRPMFLPTMIP